MNKKIKERTFIHQFRSCTSCGSVDGLEVTLFQQKGDIVSCQVCGVQYLLQGLEPLRLHLLKPQPEQQEAYWSEDSC